MQKLTDPRRPTQAEVDDHNRTHLPYRNWCPHCVQGKGKDLDHRKSAEEERGLNEFSFDYCFPGNEFGFKLTVLVGRERASGMTMATVVPMKGSMGKFTVDKVLHFMTECGSQCGDVIIKTDQEPAIEYLMKDIVEARGNDKGCRTIVEESPVKSKGSNGIVERAVQTIEGQIRVMKLALEGRLGQKIDAEANVVAFMAEYAAYLVNRLEVGKDGKTAYERVKGKSATVLGLEFGEKLMWKKKPKLKMDKIGSRWEYGIFLGIRPRSGEVWVATEEGVMKARSVKRIPIDDRWNLDSIKWVKHVPWNRYKDDEDADGDIPEEKLANEQEAANRPYQPREVPSPVVIKMKTSAPREFQIRKEDAEKHGYTRGCPGCSSWFRGLGRQPHTDKCQSRFEELMKEDARVKNARKRKEEFEEKVTERQTKKQLKKLAREDEEEERRRMNAKRTAEEVGTEDGEGRIRQRTEPVPGSADDALTASSRGSKRDRGEIEEVETIMELSPADAKVSVVKERWADLEDSDEDDELEWKKNILGENDDEAVKWISQIVVEAKEALEKAEDLLKEATFDLDEAWDDVNAKVLDATKVREGRREEICYMKQRSIWDEVDVKNCWEKTGKGPLTVKWVDTNKGSDEVPIIRCRLVARDFKTKGDKDREDLFAATPPLELKRMLISRTASRRKDGRFKKMLFVDARKAHLNPKCEEDVYIELPAEAGAELGKCGKLNFWLYGCRPAAQAWESLYAEKFIEAGFERGLGSSVSFWHRERDLACVVHGDDFTFSGFDVDLIWIEGLMKDWFEIKVRAKLGPEDTVDKEVTILGRTVRWRVWGLEYQADERHRKSSWNISGLTRKPRA